MKVVSYLKTVPAKNRNIQKELLLKKFIQGVNAVDDNGIIHNGIDLIDCDVAMIQGWVHQDKTSQHLILRDKLITTQKQSKKYVLTADANLFLYHNKLNPDGYLRYSFNGVFPQTGIYCDTNPIPSRWHQIQNDTGIQLQEYKKSGTCIVLMLQRNGGWSMNGRDVQEWALDTIRQIRKHSDRPIIIRPHPGDRQAKVYLQPHKTILKNLPNVKISPLDRPLEEDLEKAWAVINHNSSAVVGPIINGYHCFLTDPESSQCREVSNTNFANIETPNEFDRERWLHRISMMHWKFSELEDGSCWRHMRNYCQ